MADDMALPAPGGQRAAGVSEDNSHWLWHSLNQELSGHTFLANLELCSMSNVDLPSYMLFAGNPHHAGL